MKGKIENHVLPMFDSSNEHLQHVSVMNGFLKCYHHSFTFVFHAIHRMTHAISTTTTFNKTVMLENSFPDIFTWYGYSFAIYQKNIQNSNYSSSGSRSVIKCYIPGK